MLYCGWQRELLGVLEINTKKTLPEFYGQRFVFVGSFDSLYGVILVLNSLFENSVINW